MTQFVAWLHHEVVVGAAFLPNSRLESTWTLANETLAKTAEQMRVLGKLEGFVRRRNTIYQIQLRNFDLASQELARHAKRKNPDGATIAFNQLTASCVSCHTLLREGLD